MALVHALLGTEAQSVLACVPLDIMELAAYNYAQLIQINRTSNSESFNLSMLQGNCPAATG